MDVGNLQTALVTALADAGKTIAVAESCTGGMIASRITEVSGASSVFLCGVCAYSNQSKVDMLGVEPRVLEAHGAVSREVALEMAKGIRRASQADIGLATTGIAGPSGGTQDKPVGLVYVAISTQEREEVRELNLGRGGIDGEREHIRNAACINAMHMVMATIQMASERGAF